MIMLFPVGTLLLLAGVQRSLAVPTLEDLAARVEVLEAHTHEIEAHDHEIEAHEHELESHIHDLEVHDHEQDAAHAHGSYLWEWSGLYEFGIGTYRWQFRKNAQGLYGANDAMMRVVVLRAGAMAATSVLDNMHLAAEAVLENANCVQLAAGTELTVGDSCHELVFDASSSSTTFTLRISAAGRFAIYTQHV